MKVLLVTRPKDGFSGGDFKQVEDTAKAIRLRGIEVDVADNIEVNIREYDLIHLFILIMPLTLQRIQRCLSKPIIISPIYRDPRYDE